MTNIILCDNTKPDSVLPLCRQYGLGIEVQAFYHPDALENPDLLRTTSAMVSDLPVIAMHGPFGDLNPGSFDPLVRETARTRIARALELAIPLRAQHLVFHLGRVPQAGPAAPWITRSAQFWNDLMEEVPSHINVYLENFLEAQPDIVADALAQIDHPRLHANLDLGHAHCNSNTEVEQWINALNDRIRYVHLHDNHGQQDEHLGLGQGSIPISEVCLALQEHSPNAIWALEAEGQGIQQSIEWLKRNGFMETAEQ